MKQIAGYNNYYITESGKVYNKKTNHYLKTKPRPIDYCLSKEGKYKTFYVQRHLFQTMC